MDIQITFAESALRDLEDILDYYHEQNLLHAGKKLVSSILNDIELLSYQPKMGRIVPEFDIHYLRELIRPPFRIVYRIEEHRDRIIRIRRSERLLKLDD